MRGRGWTVDDAQRLYNMAAWSDGYFRVDAAGRVTLAEADCALAAVVERARQEGLRLPLLLRFPHILAHRVQALCGAFDAAIADRGYGAGYTAVYPIKVNQQASVVRSLVAAGNGRLGLEAGSKPELIAALALLPPQGVLICNGYKDRAYVRLALIGQQLGHQVTLVVEKLSELNLIIEEAEALGVEARLGLRLRLASVSAGHWQNSGGEKSKFGLSAEQTLAALERLRDSGHTDWLRLLHFHLGSQVANLRDMRAGLREAAQYYLRLREAGAPLDTVDVGGGLGVDYEGTRSRSPCSINYSLSDYAGAVVDSLAAACDAAGQPQPALISESGRALSAHHAVLVTDVIDRESCTVPPAPVLGDGAPPALRALKQLDEDRTTLPPLERLYEARHLMEQVLGDFTLGETGLADQAGADALMLRISLAVAEALNPAIRAHRDALDGLRERLADRLFCNFSVFQSLPDVWAINQIFPIVPLSRLDERPDRRGLLRDLTCDSDGRIDHYVDRDGIESSLPVHTIADGEQYLLGFFLVGAYQEILGDMHNLFGDTDTVDVALDGAGNWSLQCLEQGDRTDELLEYVHLPRVELTAALDAKIAAAGLPAAVAAACREALQDGLSGYTYLDA